MRRRFRDAFPNCYYERPRSNYHGVCFREGCGHSRGEHSGRNAHGPTIFLLEDRFHVHRRSWRGRDDLRRLRCYAQANAFRTNVEGNDYYMHSHHAGAVIEIMQEWLRRR